MEVHYLNKRATIKFLIPSLHLPEFVTLQVFSLWPEMKPKIEEEGISNMVTIEGVSIEHLLHLFYEMGEHKIGIH